MAMIKDREVLGEYVDDGFMLEECDDHITVLWFKDTMIAAFSQIAATKDELRAACQRFKDRTNGMPEIKHCRNCNNWHWTRSFQGNCWLHRWDKDKYSQDASPSEMGCKEYADRCVAATQEV